jgi:hypothetical protein
MSEHPLNKDQIYALIERHIQEIQKAQSQVMATLKFSRIAGIIELASLDKRLDMVESEQWVLEAKAALNQRANELAA